MLWSDSKINKEKVGLSKRVYDFIITGVARCSTLHHDAITNSDIT